MKRNPYLPIVMELIINNVRA